MKRASLILALLGSVGGLALACGGATSTDVFGTPTDSSGTSGTTTTSGGTSGTATSGGTSGNPTTSGGTSGTTTSGGVDGGGSGKACSPTSAGACLATEYCKLATCTATSGVCTTRPTASATESPVCGCDNVTYWNESVAAHDYGVNVQAGSGECPKTSAAKCDGNNIPCDGSRKCSFALSSSAQCNVGAGLGVCWGLPTSCPPTSGKLSECGSGKCVTRCEAIRGENPYFTNNGCH